MYPLSEIKNLSSLDNQQVVRIRGRVFSKKDCGRVLFLIVRDGIDTLQAVLVKSKEGNPLSIADYNLLRKIENESFVELVGQIYSPEKAVLACSQQSIELAIMEYTVLSRSVLDLPITLKEAACIEDKKNENQLFSSVQYVKRLDNRVLDLRTDLAQAIFRVNDGMLFYIQQYLRGHGFVEIKTPKLIGGASEGGADVFKVDYFGKPACLAQSPQLYKQMAIIGDFKRVFEVGPVFRAENSDTNRHLTEFIGVDLEMVIDQSYMEVVHLVYQLLVDLFGALNKKYEREIAIIQSFFNVPAITLASALVVVPFPDAVALLKAHGKERGDLEDFSTEDEKQLSAIVKEKYHTDLYVVTRYPSCVRPFYTMVDPNDKRYTHAYDFMLRGAEILSGAQRIHDHTTLCGRVVELGIAPSTIAHYLNAFKYGAPPHAGVGMGLERMLKYFLGLPDVRYSSLFPRDPKRLHP
ncbi:MAG: aspartate--tRNA(Asn) ligase [Candidatus Cardinium sp.]|uniref:aspartate--tRNA(Asn) ligase n=1 Tax=Cardinium endosymbiont of Dermatophagoides farinae TaxID=2597823 RepID=UPI00118393EC|nr:aspartate--tRNA(Asn) ligase [Cardinium endosymbiont of Dermatophagoides farinae]TSJ81007.1 aspartate--tRNA(Asn) ligase [Cardinium endosymbiont of Dermatophagoides farinae]UWW97033.1 MAG: aspartate--tRNA(Asn) ligase [Candidatus Cardinium sp.]